MMIRRDGLSASWRPPAQTALDAHEHDHVGLESEQSRKGKRREWAHRANLAKWHAESAAKWTISYATQLSPRSQPTPTQENLGEPGYGATVRMHPRSILIQMRQAVKYTRP
jgi:hypothetical protein